MHQMCDYLNSIGYESYIYYFPNPKEDYTPIYTEFEHLRIADTVEDSKETLIIIPEIQNVKKVQTLLTHSIVAIWWLSFTNACMFNMLRENLVDNVIHLFHSYYEYAMIRPLLHPTSRWFFASECIHDDFLKLNPDEYVEKKENIIAFNGSKDRMTPAICHMLNLPTINLKNLSREKVIESLQKCKLYVDFGYHPGKDHLPREAAMCGCVVVTNKSGSAAYDEDVPIKEKVTFEKDLLELIPYFLENYKEVYNGQEQYRTIIKDEKHVFHENAKFFMIRIKNEFIDNRKDKEMNDIPILSSPESSTDE
jgi:hypothetical protein